MTATAPARMSEESLRQARVLILDDEVGALCTLANMLGRLGFTHVETLSEPQHFLERFTTFQPDLVITDLLMPEVDGFEIIEAVRARLPQDTFFPVLVLTGDQSPEDKRRALVAGATEILMKPFDLSELLMRMRNLIRMHFLHREIQNQNAALERQVAVRTQELEKTCTALERALAALKHSQRQIVEQERFRAFGEMAGGVVHDFNNALMTIIGYSELMIRDPAMLQDPAQVGEHLRTIHTAGCDASQVVSRLRDFSRPREAGEQFAPVLLNKLLENVVSLTQPKWKTLALEEGRIVNVQFELARVPPVHGNGAELREAVTNLIFNAVDALPKGGAITLRTRREDAQVVLEVADNGLGMTPEVRRRCLDPYFTTKGQRGTGLGLAMVFGIIKRHEGTLEIESTPGRGTTFRIRLPIHEDQPQNSLDTASPASRPLRVLVVDDDPVSLEVLAKILTADGHQVTLARNGGEAVLQFLQARFDVVLTDHGMPGMNGAQLANFIRRNRAEQPVFLVTSYDIDPLKPPAGIDLVLRKPIVREQIRRALADLDCE